MGNTTSGSGLGTWSINAKSISNLEKSANRSHRRHGVLLCGAESVCPRSSLANWRSQRLSAADDRLLSRAEAALADADIAYFGEELQADGKAALIRLTDRGDQLRAQSVLQRALGDGFIVALNLAPTTPIGW